MVANALPAIPFAPFNDGGEGGYRRLAPLNSDIDIARRALGEERWPISPDKRKHIVDWLLLVLDESDDMRTKVNAARALLAADKLNLEQAKILIEAEREAQPQELTVTHRGNVTLTAQLDILAQSFAGAADRQGAGHLPTDGPREPLDSGLGQGGHDPQAG